MANFYINSIKYSSRFYRLSTSRYKIHSPFLYAFIEDVFDNKKEYYCFSLIEQFRKKLLKNHNPIELIDYGAGSRKKSTKHNTISQIAKNTISPIAQCQVLFKIINRIQPSNIIEIGSSLGICALYLSHAAPKSKVYSLEGNPSSLQIAQNQAQFLKLKNIEFILGNFNTTLPHLIQTLDKIDFAFIDGNHQYEATIQYFNLLLTRAHSQSVFVFDDIYWSEGMKKAWEQIKKHPSVKASIDVYTYGIIFFDPQFLEPKHIKLVPIWLKPWQYIML